MWLGCGSGHTGVALVVPAGARLPPELVGEFSCASDTYRSHLMIPADGLYLETQMFSRSRSHDWEPQTFRAPPCNPLGRATYQDGALVLDFQAGTCEQLEDPILLPLHRRIWRLVQVDGSGFVTTDLRCRRVR
ncbi:Hypothetical protein A7982_07814 [Minicystis rosea]|nr:Hypothetical protein A7982_07814 [Minicystis rosea]